MDSYDKAEPVQFFGVFSNAIATNLSVSLLTEFLARPDFCALLINPKLFLTQ